ncbi:type II toxin-antitoxin system HicA family toxin [Segatella buccae]|uniref:type II toxin-antitoxin system HicA family toxin n=1 Tax=Segatella buccae TaxID=28126 RepID=UPI0028D0C11C|nr:type II toxin-antitoxin system HicA family toxin [Segatella buccae]
MKFSEFYRELIAAGCYVIRKGGEHNVWYSPKTKRKHSVGRHPSQEVPTGTLRKARRVLLGK